MAKQSSPHKFRIRLHSTDDREAIYRLRYDIYSSELHQHEANPEHRLTDKLDEFNLYLGVHHEEKLVGFVSITPPGHDSYSIDKYLPRDQIPIDFNDGLYEIRILAVDQAYRRSSAAVLLMYAAYRLIRSLGGTDIMAMGRVEVLDVYLKLGMETVGRRIKSGEVEFELLHADVVKMTLLAQNEFRGLVERLVEHSDWELGLLL